jgi:cytochrome P450
VVILTDRLTSSLFCNIISELLQNPDIKRKLRDEVINIYESKNHLTFTSIKKHLYLDKVVNETLRYELELYQTIPPSRVA